MKRKFTLLIAALALLTMIVQPGRAWGQGTTATQTGFTSVSGTSLDGNSTIAFTSYKGGGTSDPAISGSSIRLYQNASGNTAGYIVIGVSNNYVITRASITTSAATTAGYKLSDTDPGNSTPAKNTFNESDHACTNGGEYEVTDISSQYIIFANFGTTKSQRLDISAISVTYESAGGGQTTTYTVTYHSNVTGNDETIEVVYNEGDDVTVAENSFTYTGHAFTEWNTNAGGTGTGYQPGATIESIDANIDLYAQWEASSDITATLTATNLELTGSYSDDTEITIDGITYIHTDLMKNSNNIQAKATSGTIKNTTAYPGDITSVVITHTGTARATTINGSTDGTNWTQVETGNGSITADFSGHGYKYFQITRGSNAAYWTKIEITYSTGGGGSLDPSDLAITNASTDLTFDLYPSATAQVINYTTSSTGAITITPETSEYFSYVHDVQNKTITVTPLALTPSAQTVTISQAADDDYYAGTATFTVSVVSSAPLANIAELTALPAAGSYNVALVDAVVTYVGGSNAYIQDASGAVVMHNSNHGLTVGDVLNGTATVAYQLYNANPQITDLSGVTPVSGTAPDPTEVAQSAWNYTFNNVLSQYFKVTGATITQSNSKYYVSLNNENIQLYKQGGSISTLDLTKTYSITGFPTLYNSTKELTIYADPEVETSPEPSITVANATVNVTAEGGEGTLTVSYENITTVVAEVWFCNAAGTEAATYDWITASINANNNVEYLVVENDGEARTAYFKVSALDDETNIVYSDLVTINQAAPVTPPTTDNYELFSGALVEGDYIIYYEGSAMKNTVSNNRLSYETVTPENDVIITDDVTIVWHIAQSGDYWTIYSDEAEAYAASTGTKNQAQMLSDGTDDKALWSVTGTETYNFVNKYNANASVNAYLRNNVTTQQNYGFACYAEGTGGALSLYKKADNTPSITINPGPYNLNSEGGDAELEVTYSNMPTDPQAVVIFYESNGETPLTENPTWITATINANGNVDGHIDANTGNARSAYFKVKGKDADGNDVYSGLVTVNQAAYTLSIVFETTSLDIEAGGEQNRIISFEYEGLGENPTFTVRTYDASGETQTTYDWLTTSITDVHKVSITVAANTGDARSAYFKVYGENGTVNTESNLVTINQAESVQMYTVTFDCDGGTFVPNDDFATVSEQKQAGTYNLPSATKVGWAFNGWNDGETTYEANAEYTVSADVTFTAQWTEVTTGTIYFGNNGTNIDNTSVTGDDSMGNTWTIISVFGSAGSSFTQSSDYSQVGSNKKPATSITFTTTLPTSTTITAFSAKFVGSSNDSHASISMSIGDTEVGTGSYTGTGQAIVTNTIPGTATTLTITVSDIAGGVKCYYISYTVDLGTDPMISAPATVNLSSTDTEGEFEYSIVNPATGVSLAATTTATWISNITVTNNKVTFNTTPNTSETEDREGTITLSYTGAENKTVTVIQSKVDYATLPYAYDGGKTNLPACFTADLGDDYGTSPKFGFRKTGHYLVLKLNEAPVALSYDIKGNGFSGGTFKVQKSADGVTYEDVATYTTLGDTQSVTHINLGTTVRYIKWVYTEKSTGNVALGNIHASNEYDTYGDVTFNDLDLTATSESLIVHTGSVVTITGTLTNTSSDNLIIEDGGQLVFDGTGVKATMKKKTVGESKAEHWYTIASPVNNIDFANITNLTNAATFDLYRYDEATYTWENYKNTAHTDFVTAENGRGYLYYNSDGNELSFAGELNNSASYDLTASGAQMNGLNLIGNPFTQDITLANISLSDDAQISEGFYVLSNNSDWVASVTTVKPCEGFIVKVNKATTATFSKSTGSSKSRANRDYIAFTVANNQYEDVAYAMFSNGLGLDKINHRNADIPMVYIPQNGQNYAIATMDDNTQAFELNFKAMTTGQYTLSYKAEGKYSYLHVIDRLTGEDIDMLLDGEYSFIGSPRDNEARFIVKLSYNANIDEIEVNDNFAYQNGSDIIVNGDGELQVFDVTGRMVMNTKINGIQTVNVPATGMYIFRMVGESVQTQKIVVR